MIGKVILANAFSVGMLPGERQHVVQFTPLSPDEAVRVLRFRKNAHEVVAEVVRLESDFKVTSAIRHPATEAIALNLLGLRRDQVEQVPSVTLEKDAVLFVFLPRWQGGRPPETRDYTAEELSVLTDGVDIWMCRLI
jgi:hypothetical protein